MARRGSGDPRLPAAVREVKSRRGFCALLHRRKAVFDRCCLQLVAASGVRGDETCLATILRPFCRDIIQNY